MRLRPRSLGRGAVALGLKAAAAVADTPARLKQLKADHDLRHRPSGFRFVLAEAIDQLRDDHWDALTANASVCLSRAFLRLVEQAGPSRLKMHYALVYGDGRAVAAVACQSLAVDASTLPRRRAAGKMDRLRERGLQRVKQRILVCGNLLGWGPQGLAFAPDVDPRQIWPGVAEALYRIRRQDVLFGQTDLVMVKDVDAADAGIDAALRRYSYAAIDTEPNMVLQRPSEWRGFADYLAALRSDYRTKIKKQVREVEAAGLVVERLDAAGVRAHGDALHALYREVHDKQRLRLVTLSPEWIPALADAFGNAFRTIVLRRPADGRLAGFVTSLRDRDGAIGYYIGFDKAWAAEGVPLYLRLLYALIEDALDSGAAWVSLGRTALEPKATLGAVGQPLRCYVRHRIPALNGVVQALIHAAPEPDEPPARHPFKPPRAR